MLHLLDSLEYLLVLLLLLGGDHRLQALVLVRHLHLEELTQLLLPVRLLHLAVLLLHLVLVRVVYTHRIPQSQRWRLL